MQAALQALNSELLWKLAPMWGAFLVLVLALGVVRLFVGSRFVRGLAAYAATFAWLGWVALYYKAV